MRAISARCGWGRLPLCRGIPAPAVIHGGAGKFQLHERRQNSLHGKPRCGSQVICRLRFRAQFCQHGAGVGGQLIQHNPLLHQLGAAGCNVQGIQHIIRRAQGAGAAGAQQLIGALALVGL